jgi:hypothetical protein
MLCRSSESFTKEFWLIIFLTQIIKLLIMQFSPVSSYYLALLYPVLTQPIYSSHMARDQVSHPYKTTGSRGSSVKLSQYSDWLRTRWPGFDPRQRQRIFSLASASRPALGPTQPPIQWVLGVLSPGVKRGRGVMLTTHPHLVSRLRMSRSYTSSPPCASMACSGITLYFYVYKTTGKIY